MSIETTIKVTCDYSGCKNNSSGSGPSVVQWIKEEIESGKASSPEEAAYLVILNQNGIVKTFCGQYHAALHFMPPGYDVTKKKVQELPVKVVDEGPVGQPDGAGPEEVG